MINERKVRKFCKEDISKIENYNKAIADTTQTWHCHHRTEIWWNCSAKELKENKCYYHRKACELIFLTRSEHISLHMKGKTLSEETRRKLSEAHKNISEETRRKLSEAHKGKHLSKETRNKMSEANKGKHHSDDTRIKISEANKGKHHSNETRNKISEANKGKTWKVIDGKRVWLAKEV